MTKAATATLLPASSPRGERVPQDVIDELLSQTSLLELVGESTRVQHHDGVHQAQCPFHAHGADEWSLQVDPSEQRFVCSVCNFRGSAIGWLMYHDGLAFPEAILSLSQRLGIDVRAWIPDDVSEAVCQATQALLADVDAFHADQLLGSPAASYLEKRGISLSTARHFGLGYAPATSDGLDQAFRTQRRELWHRGLLIRQNDGAFRARFSDRLMFPIRNKQGRTVGHGARTLGDARLKYLNSPSSALFSKRHLVYGLHEALRSASTEPYLLVEGYMDVLALAEHGFPTAVATLGTAVSDHHVRTIFSHTDRLVTCFDADAAGRKAAVKLARIALPILEDAQQLLFTQLPTGEDPDSLLRASGCQAMKKILTDAVSLDEFLHNHLGHALDLESIGGKAALAARARPLAQTIRSPELRQQVIDRFEMTIGIPWFDT